MAGRKANLSSTPSKGTSAGSQGKLSSCPSNGTFTLISVAVNAVTLVVLIPASLVLYWQLQTQTDLCPASPSTAPDLSKLPDVSQDGGKGTSDANRYCFREEPRACEERGEQVKAGENGESLCCGHLGNHLYGVMSQSVQDRLQLDTARGQRLQRIKQYIAQLHRDPQAASYRPAAHVGISPNGNLTGPDNQVPRVQWEESGEVSFLTGGVVHRGDRLVVTKPGFYYVYSGLQFNVDPTKEQSGAIVAYLFRTVNGTEESRRKLMTSRESSCRRTRGEGEVGPVSMHMAGIFLLRKEDEVSVRTSSQSLLNRAPSTTYLGLHMV